MPDLRDARLRGERSETSAAELDERLASAFGALRARRHAPLAPLTTFRVGGSADWLLEARNSREVVEALRMARASGVPPTLLGGGSNVLISDEGIRGLVLRVHGGDIVQETADIVRADAGVTINGLVRWTINRGLAGLEAWAGTPGTVGGGVFGNAHFKGRLLGELVEFADLATADAEVKRVPGSEMEFDYDCSRLHRTGEVLVAAGFRVGRGEPERLRKVARESLAYRKQTQPLDAASAGCIFRNPDPGDPLPAGLPPSAGALIDRAGLKGYGIGHARVSPTHANFIVNDGGATARDIRALITLCKQRVAAMFNVVLREEIRYLGEFG
ncbi:MAG: UDP-N-acetylmuramate dehydrogenase [Acidobacteria bacterium]|nr:UDP-N-acetylmuramate dehydrogenase [Acidobacteriota bacterium]